MNVGSGSTVGIARKWPTCFLHRLRVGRHWRVLRYPGNKASPLARATWKRGRLHREIPLDQGPVDFEFPETCARSDWKTTKRTTWKSEITKWLNSNRGMDCYLGFSAVIGGISQTSIELKWVTNRNGELYAVWNENKKSVRSQVQLFTIFRFFIQYWVRLSLDFKLSQGLKRRCIISTNQERNLPLDSDENIHKRTLKNIIN